MTRVIYWPPRQERERQPAWEGFFRDHYWRGLTGRSFTADRRTRLRGSGGRDPGRFPDSCISAAGGHKGLAVARPQDQTQYCYPTGYAISSTTGKSTMP